MNVLSLESCVLPQVCVVAKRKTQTLLLRKLLLREDSIEVSVWASQKHETSTLRNAETQLAGETKRNAIIRSNNIGKRRGSGSGGGR